MTKTYLWMIIFLGVNWGGFAFLLLRTMRRMKAAGGTSDREASRRGLSP